MKFCHTKSFTLPKQSQRSRSILKERLDFWDCFLNNPKDPSYKMDLDLWDCLGGKKNSVL